MDSQTHDQPKVIYQWSPLTIGHLVNSQFIEETSETDVPAFFKHLRGSSNGWTDGEEIWVMTHLVEHSSPRTYYHCLVLLDRQTLKVKKTSILFKIDQTSIEYCLGLIVEPDRILLGYSENDHETFISIYPRPEIDHFLFPEN